MRPIPLHSNSGVSAALIFTAINVHNETGTIQWKKQVVILGHYLEVHGKKICNAKMRTENLSKFSNTTQAQAIHVPQNFKQIYWGISGYHPCGNFLIISLGKFRGNEGELSIWIFPPPYHIESLRIFPYGDFRHVSLIFPSKFQNAMEI